LLVTADYCKFDQLALTLFFFTRPKPKAFGRSYQIGQQTQPAGIRV